MVDTDSESILGGDAVNVNQLISELERERQKLQKMEDEAERVQSELDKMISKYEVRLKESESLKKKSKAEAAREAKSILAEANSTIEKAIREIRESSADAEVVKEVRKKVQGQKNRVERISSEEPIQESSESVPLNIDDAKIDMNVSIPSLNVTGTISELLKDKNEAVVSVGSTSLRINIGKLEKLADGRSFSCGCTVTNHTSATTRSRPTTGSSIPRFPSSIPTAITNSWKARWNRAG